MKKLITISFLLIVLSTCFISAGFDYNDYVLKWSLCNALNMSENGCDTWWEAVADFPNNMQEINETQISSIIDERLKNYYNKTESNITNISGCMSLEEFTNRTNVLRNSIDDNYATKEEVGIFKDVADKEKRSSGDDTIFIIIGVVCACGLMGFLYIKIKQKKFGNNNEMFSKGKPQVRKIHGKKYMDVEEENKELKEELKAKSMSWIDYVKKIRKENPELSYKEAMKKAKKTWKK